MHILRAEAFFPCFLTRDRNFFCFSDVFPSVPMYVSYSQVSDLRETGDRSLHILRA